MGRHCRRAGSDFHAWRQRKYSRDSPLFFSTYAFVDVALPRTRTYVHGPLSIGENERLRHIAQAIWGDLSLTAAATSAGDSGRSLPTNRFCSHPIVAQSSMGTLLPSSPTSTQTPLQASEFNMRCRSQDPDGERLFFLCPRHIVGQGQTARHRELRRRRHGHGCVKAECERASW